MTYAQFQFTQQDAFAFRRALSGLDIPEDVRLSPLAKVMIEELARNKDDNSRTSLERILYTDVNVRQWIMSLDPEKRPTCQQDDMAYVRQYLGLVTSKPFMPPPDTSRTNGSTQLLLHLHDLNNQLGPRTALEEWQKIKDEHPLEDPAQEVVPAWALNTAQAFKSRPTVAYYDDEKIVQHNEITAVIGQPGAGKSFWALQKMAELADHLPVVYVAAEGLNPERIFALEQARQGRLISNNLTIIDQVLDLTSEAVVDSFVRAVKPLQPKVVAIDTFAACTPGIDENSSKDMQPVLNRLRTRLIEELGCAILLIHHTTKDGKTFRGSSALRGNVANMYYLHQDEGLVTLKSDKQRDSEPAPDRHYRLVSFETRLNPTNGQQLSSAAIVRADDVIATRQTGTQLTTNQRDILEALEPFEHGLTTTAIMSITGMAKATLWRNIQKLARANLVRLGERGEPIYMTEPGRQALVNN